MDESEAAAARHTPASRYLRCAGRELHYTEWGAADAPPIIMWHGLARTGRDFDELARALAGGYRVICPDAIGRGLSQWSPDPAAEYRLDFYATLARAHALLAVMEGELAQRDFLAGTEPTIADVACYAYVAHA
ncbi:MAG: alpha/beta fold hydrolase, partial [Alcaligenes sp.]